MLETREISAVVLAGGKSSRIGGNKLLLPLGTGTVISNLLEKLLLLFAEVIVVTDHPQEYSSLPVKVTTDLISCLVKNSLTGLHTGLTVASNPYSLVLAGDMPFANPSLLAYLCELSDGYDVTIPKQGPHFQPLCAVYHKNCLPHIEKLLLQNQYKVTAFFKYMKVRCVTETNLESYDPELLSFFNINTAEDYLRAKEMMAKANLFLNKTLP